MPPATGACAPTGRQPGSVLDGPVLDGPVLDGPVLDSTG
jgi:hypothetical protein